MHAKLHVLDNAFQINTRKTATPILQGFQQHLHIMKYTINISLLLGHHH